ncbi:MAG TPA: membrane protein insertion efficiency factor YidD [Sulfurovum sp. UBA12169]|jgi:conserved hypothetical protein YidD|nr:MAG TPA: membrane protein insertion efficiency factor YidD [Sulfurovum sp. UBA12169]
MKSGTKFWILPIKGYQYISKMLPANCRYYPTCSEYAKWQFEFNTPHKALMASTLRILRCNQLFAGGIDYPLISFIPPKTPVPLKPAPYTYKINIHYWLVPKNNQHYYVVKQFSSRPNPV